MPFLTDLDERADVKGSRDPLGIVPLWSKSGREVVGNLTTVSGTVRGFTTLLVGLEFADMLREQYRSDAPASLGTFLRYEQLAAYARFKCHQDKAARGFRRVSRRLNEGRPIRISADPEAQILSNQKTYGLWGLFTVPARSSGVLMKGEPRLTDKARDFVHRHYFPMLGNGRGVKPVLDLLRRDSFNLQPDGRDSELLNALRTAWIRPRRTSIACHCRRAGAGSRATPRANSPASAGASSLQRSRTCDTAHAGIGSAYSVACRSSGRRKVMKKERRVIIAFDSNSSFRGLPPGIECGS